READQIEIRARDRDVLSQRAPVREAGLQLVIADLLISGAARSTDAAGTHEGHRDSITHLPTADGATFRSDFAREFVPWNVRQANIRIVPQPAVPIASAETGRLYRDHHAVIGGHGVAHILDAQGLAELAVDGGSHDGSRYAARPICAVFRGDDCRVESSARQ